MKLSAKEKGDHEELFFYLNIALLIIYTVPALWLFYISKMNIDRSAIWNIMIYITSFLLRAILWGVSNLEKESIIQGIMTIVEYLVAFVMQISLYFFVFEMKTVKEILTC
jgi:hypothetical protein